jgi:hypothetical protein
MRWTTNAQGMPMPRDEFRDVYRRTPPLSREGTREILEEMANPPKDTPERRRMFERVRLMRALHKEQGLELPDWMVQRNDQHRILKTNVSHTAGTEDTEEQNSVTSV